MKKTIISYGLMAGAIVSAMLFITQPLFRNGTLNHQNGVYVGFTSMIVAFSLIFFGVKSYRDNHLNGSITFGKAFSAGILIALVGSLCYAITWEFIMRFVYPDFAQWYSQCQIDQLVKEGASDIKLAEAKLELQKFEEMYANPFIRFGFTLLEILPVGLIITLISAGLLRNSKFLPAES
jgi:predicted ABC-type exoprotein transport system permease subunit